VDFVYGFQDSIDGDPEFDLTGVCEADEVCVVAGEKRVNRRVHARTDLKKDEDGSRQTNRWS
jgi:hypothetical protein